MITRCQVRLLLSPVLTLLAILSLSSTSHAQTKVNPQQIANMGWCRQENIRFVDASNTCGWSGANAGAWINSAYADLPTTGGRIHIAAGAYTIPNGSEIVMNAKPVEVECAGGSSYSGGGVSNGAAALTYTGTGVLWTFAPGNGKDTLKGCTLLGPGVSSGATGLVLGGNSGNVIWGSIEKMDISGFQTGLQFSSNVFVMTLLDDAVHDNGTNGNHNVYMPGSLSNTGENIKIIGGDYGGKTSGFSTTCIEIDNATDLKVVGASLDQCGMTVNGVNIFTQIDAHIENPGGATSSPFFTFGASCNFCTLTIPGGEWLEDGNGAGRVDFIEDDSGVSNHAVLVNIQGGVFVPGAEGNIAQLVKFNGAACCGQGVVGSYLNGFGGFNFTNTFGGNVFQAGSSIVGLDCGTTSSCSNAALSQNGKLKIIKGDAPLVSGTPSTVTITGFSPAFASSTSYDCTASNATTQANPVKVTRVSASSITITGPNSVTDTVSYICVGQ